MKRPMPSKYEVYHIRCMFCEREKEGAGTNLKQIGDLSLVRS